ncbi:MAG: extracellular solute-binding protein [Defluviitaleaceae bacterium]|nr:extracellular solute-binding protein [Defluviitaleaceae bacterium]
MSKFKKLTFVPFLLGAMLLATACGGNTPAGGGGTAPTAPTPPPANATPAPTTQDQPVMNLTYWVVNSDPIRLPVLSSHVAAFNDSQDRIYVEYVPIPQDDALNRINVALSANAAPDATDLMHGWVAGLVLRDALLNLEPHLATWAGYNEMIPALMDEIRNLDAAGNAHMLPATSNTHTIWVRADWLADQGITNQQSWYWDDFFNAIEAMTDPSQTRFGHSLRGGPGSAATIFEMIFSNSGEQVFVNGNTTINNPQNVAFLERYFALFGTHTPEGDLNAGHMEITANFGTGIAGSMVHNLGSYQNHVDAFEDYDMFEAIPMPYSVLGTRNLSTSVHGYSIFSGTDHPEASFEFLTWMVNAQNNSEWNQTLGQLPSNIRVMDEAWLNNALHISTMMGAVNSPNTTSFGHPQFLPDFASINNNIAAPAIQETLMGLITVQELLDLWADALNESLDDYLTNVVGR